MSTTTTDGVLKRVTSPNHSRRVRAELFRPALGYGLAGLLVLQSVLPPVVSAAELRIFTADVSRPVWIDGEAHGLTPTTVSGVEAGTREILIGTAPGDAAWAHPFRIEVELDDEDVRNVDVPPLQSLNVEASGRAARVRLDGEDMGFTPLQLLVPTDRSVEITVAGEIPQLYRAGMAAESTLVLTTPMPSRGAPRVLHRPSRRKYLYPLGAVAFGVLGVWARQTADRSYDEYLSTVDRSRLDDHFDRAARYDDIAVGCWVAAEALLLASVFSWLRNDDDTGLSIESDNPTQVEVGWTVGFGGGGAR